MSRRDKEDEPDEMVHEAMDTVEDESLYMDVDDDKMDF